MKNTRFARFMAAAAALLMLLQPAAFAEADAVQSLPVEGMVFEAEEQPLPGDPEPSESVEPAESMEPAESAEPTEGPTVAPEPTEPAREDRVFDETVSVASDTWRHMDLRRAEGFEGKLAAVSGTLRLEDVRIDGVPASQAALTAWFDLAPGAAIVCDDAEPLALGLSAFSINKGASRTLSLSCGGAALSGKQAQWSTSDKRVVSVDRRGKIKARARGEAVITARYGGLSAACAVVVTDIVLPRKVALEAKALTVGLYGTRRMKVTLTPSNAETALTWRSSDPAVASVDGDGRVTGAAAGEAVITVTTANGKSASCKITVREVLPAAVDFKKLYVTLCPGERFAAEAAVSPSDATRPGVRFESDNAAVAEVDEDGVITAAGYGTATITARCEADAGIWNTCKVCVIAPDAPRLEGLIIGINPGHQITTVKKGYPLAPGSSRTAKGVKTGASGHSTGQHEYEVVLQIGLKLKRILEENGATVVITRTTNDVMLTNIDRAQMLNAAGCDVALQLHNNSCSNSSKSGVSGYIRTTGDWVEESRGLSDCICRGMSATTGFANLGVKVYNDYMSLNWTTTPSVLLEMGYLSNSGDDHRLALDETREQLAQGIFLGICEYFGR